MLSPSPNSSKKAFSQVALVGKYVDLPDAYLSVTEALRAGGFANDAKVEIKWVVSDDCESATGAARELGDVDAVCVPGGFGVRGIEGKLGALKFAREQKIPTLGLCLGLQCMVIEAARNLGGISDANSAEFDPTTKNPVIATMAGQEKIVAGEADMGGTMRLGAQKSELVEGTKTREVYGKAEITERHRHRYEMNNRFIESIEKAGMKISGYSSAQHLVETVEIPDHPWFIAVQFHPEFTSSPRDGHPLFASFIDAAKTQHQKSK